VLLECDALLGKGVALDRCLPPPGSLTDAGYVQKELDIDTYRCLR
jgi:hypothetical protein